MAVVIVLSQIQSYEPSMVPRGTDKRDSTVSICPAKSNLAIQIYYTLLMEISLSLLTLPALIYKPLHVKRLSHHYYRSLLPTIFLVC